ncbi:HTH-type transcriptional regulator / antitoxin HigA [Mucilaginibacter gossypiicola]|uniref:HTH-type transcriptional regulator / antitoxin HigA n=1 Tax=Mucilaginibacter gossypiicola TaxID=551995 RepID=A0A1H8MRL4_9SPHI|nr:helix-turn-helix domain-containing protein [Mucilaginibacter gossypiicola]SEO19878.1 HTH-type transcriptional regulator / antitoxin HigA [Mucilaginibacter gossypiicola]
MKTTTIKYTVIKSREQYYQYCKELEDLLAGDIDVSVQDEIDLITLLIEKYDEDHNSFTETDPIVLLRSFMADHHLKSQDLSEILGISKGYVSDILNYKKGLSKEVIRKLSDYFKVKQEAFNRPYKLSSIINPRLLNPNLSNTTKQLRYVKH